MSVVEPVSILHLSDIHFGRYHAFETLSDDSLADSLLRDLAALRAQWQIHPQALVVTGDLAEWALPDEYAEAENFLSKLRSELDLPLESMVVAPGGHDVSHPLCEAYFLNRRGEGKEPIPPYGPKWKTFGDLYARFYGLEFDPDASWRMFPLPELGIVLCGSPQSVPDR